MIMLCLHKCSRNYTVAFWVRIVYSVQYEETVFGKNVPISNQHLQHLWHAKFTNWKLHYLYMYLPDSWQVLKCHPTQGYGNDIFLPLLIATSQLVADARKEDSLPACGENWVNTVDYWLFLFSMRAAKDNNTYKVYIITPHAHLKIKEEQSSAMCLMIRPRTTYGRYKIII